MAGSKAPGLEGARADLFRGRPWLIVPTERSDVHSIAFLQEIVRGIGARPFVVDPERHDTLMTWVSHLPHAAAAAVARAVSAGGAEGLERYAGPGLLDTTRIADSPADLLLELALADPESLAAAIENVREELARIAGSLRRRDAAELHAYFAEAVKARRSFEP